MKKRVFFIPRQTNISRLLYWFHLSYLTTNLSHATTNIKPCLAFDNSRSVSFLMLLQIECSGDCSAPLASKTSY